MVVNPAQDVGELSARIGVVQLGGDDERLQGRGPVTTAVGTAEHPGPATEGHAAPGALRGVVGQADMPVGREPAERVPALETAAAKRFLAKALNGLKVWEKPTVINAHKAPFDVAALAELKKQGKCPEQALHRQVKYLNNVIEADHGKLKQLIRPVRGFKTLKTAYATIKGFKTRPASSSVRLASVPQLWPRPSSLSANGLSS